MIREQIYFSVYFHIYKGESRVAEYKECHKVWR